MEDLHITILHRLDEEDCPSIFIPFWGAGCGGWEGKLFCLSLPHTAQLKVIVARWTGEVLDDSDIKDVSSATVRWWPSDLHEEFSWKNTLGCSATPSTEHLQKDTSSSWTGGGFQDPQEMEATPLASWSVFGWIMFNVGGEDPTFPAGPGQM